jgi:hypothetical protein
VTVGVGVTTDGKLKVIGQPETNDDDPGDIN